MAPLTERDLEFLSDILARLLLAWARRRTEADAVERTAAGEEVGGDHAAVSRSSS